MTNSLQKNAYYGESQNLGYSSVAPQQSYNPSFHAANYSVAQVPHQSYPQVSSSGNFNGAQYPHNQQPLSFFPPVQPTFPTAAPVYSSNAQAPNSQWGNQANHFQSAPTTPYPKYSVDPKTNVCVMKNAQGDDYVFYHYPNGPQQAVIIPNVTDDYKKEMIKKYKEQHEPKTSLMDDFKSLFTK
jgi:hypothetical protein